MICRLKTSAGFSRLCSAAVSHMTELPATRVAHKHRGLMGNGVRTYLNAISTVSFTTYSTAEKDVEISMGFWMVFWKHRWFYFTHIWTFSVMFVTWLRVLVPPPCCTVRLAWNKSLTPKRHFLLMSFKRHQATTPLQPPVIAPQLTPGSASVS